MRLAEARGRMLGGIELSGDRNGHGEMGDGALRGGKAAADVLWLESQS